jgi:hypothetical protein
MTESCRTCGQHRWSFDGYCLSVKCAGSYKHPNWPKTKPANIAEEQAGALEVKRPRSKRLRREAEAYYASKGKVAPWLLGD